MSHIKTHLETLATPTNWQCWWSNKRMYKKVCLTQNNGIQPGIFGPHAAVYVATALNRHCFYLVSNNWFKNLCNWLRGFVKFCLSVERNILHPPPKKKYNSPEWDRTSSLSALQDRTQAHNAVTTPVDEWSARSREFYLQTHNSHKRQTSLSPTGFESERS
jgi:hypothetical protein